VRLAFFAQVADAAGMTPAPGALVPRTNASQSPRRGAGAVVCLRGRNVSCDIDMAAARATAGGEGARVIADFHFLRWNGSGVLSGRASDVGALRNLKAGAGVPLATVTPDDGDVRWIARRAHTQRQQMQTDSEARWNDLGDRAPERALIPTRLDHPLGAHAAAVLCAQRPQGGERGRMALHRRLAAPRGL